MSSSTSDKSRKKELGSEFEHSDSACFPTLYQQGPNESPFLQYWTRILGIFYDQAFASNGQTSDKCIIGTAMFTSIIWIVNIQIYLKMNHLAWIQHIFVWGSIHRGDFFREATEHGLSTWYC
ncbi:hypothetical protein ZOSMA_12G00440 [Zostera marina]|uniref:P-type ATPase C-terminal domain-containing protein n=1 Tax=Zostera marina TaxID=29655 RepID=A0A0K9Q1M2_ZOSMR|nr:hypothetical protein ZOSMA_12G00440 [Zostera marina]